MDAAELRIIISAVVSQAQEQLSAISRDAEEMAAQLQASGTVASEALDGVKRAAEELKLQMDEVKNNALDVHVEDSEAKASMDDLMLKMAQLHEQAVTDAVKIRVDAETAMADSELEAFKALLDTIPKDKRVRIDMERRTVSYGDTGAPANAGGGATVGGVLLATGISALIPSIAPLAAAATNALMGLAGAFSAASAGVAAFGAVAITNLSPVFQATSQLEAAQKAYATATTAQQQTQALQQEAAAMYGLDAAQRQAVTSLSNFEDWWKSFAASFESPVFADFSKALQMIETLMNDMRPVIQAGAAAIGQLMDSMNKGLQSSEMKTFFQWLATQAGPAIKMFGDVAGNVFKGFASLMMAFTPSIKSVETGMVSLTARFASWSASLKGTKHFQEFLQYAAQSGSAVMSLLGQLSNLVGTLLQRMAPVGLVLIQVVSDLAKWVNQLLTTNPLISQLVKIVMDAVRNILEFVDAVIKVLTWLGKTHPAIMDLITALGLATGAFFAFNAVMDANPIALVIIGIAALVAAGVELVNHWTQVRQFFVQLWSWFTTETSKVWGSITTFFRTTWTTITTDLTKAWNAIVQFFKKYGTDILAALTGPIGLLVLALVKHWSTISSDASKAWQGIKNTLHNLWSGAITDAENIFNGLGKFFEGLWTQAEQWGSNLIQHFAQGIENAIRFVTNAVSHVTSAISGLFGGHSSSVSVAQSVTSSWPASAPPSVGATGGITIHQINVTGNVTRNEQELANTVASAMQKKLSMRTQLG